MSNSKKARLIYGYAWNELTLHYIVFFGNVSPRCCLQGCCHGNDRSVFDIYILFISMYLKDEKGTRRLVSLYTVQLSDTV